MTINELLAQGVLLRSVAEVITITDPDDENPYGTLRVIWSGEPQDLKEHTDWKWADREILSIWPIQDTRYPLLQIEVA